MYNAQKDSIGNVREQVLAKCWQYLHENFHKFSEANKLKVALALGQKSMPQQIDQNITITEMNDIMIDNRVKEYIIGN